MLNALFGNQDDADEQLLQAAIRASRQESQAGQVQFSSDSEEELNQEEQELQLAQQVSRLEHQKGEQERVLNSLLNLCDLLDLEPVHQVSISEKFAEFFEDCPNGARTLTNMDFEQLKKAFISLDGPTQLIVKNYMNHLLTEEASSTANTFNTFINLSMSSEDSFKSFVMQAQQAKKEEEKKEVKEPAKPEIPVAVVKPAAKKIEIIDLTKDDETPAPVVVNPEERKRAFLVAFEKRQQELQAQQQQPKKEEVVKTEPDAKRSKPDSKKV